MNTEISLVKNGDSYQMSGQKQFSPEEPIGEFLDALQSICRAGVDFIHPQDAKRHIYLMDRFRIATHTRHGQPAKVVAEMPIRGMAYQLANWVRRYCYSRGPDSSRLLPHFALDTSMFILQLAVGAYGRGEESWSTEAMVDGELWQRDHFDRNFKKDFTSNARGRFIARVPPGYSVAAAGTQGRKVLLNEGGILRFRVRRCHLSESWNDFSTLEVFPEPSLPNISSDFLLIGEAISIAPELGMKEYVFNEPLGLDLPPNWITHEVVRLPNWVTQLVPAPTWDKDAPQPESIPDMMTAADLNGPRDAMIHAAIDKVWAHCDAAPPATDAPVPRPPVISATAVTPQPVLNRTAFRTAKLVKKGRPVPPNPVCAKCGVELSPAMLVWPVDKRLCRKCRREARTRP